MEAPKIPTLRLCLDGFWWTSGSAALSAACQGLESHSTSNIQIVKLCLFFMGYGAIGRRPGMCHSSVALFDSSVISPVHVPSSWKGNRADQKDRQSCWQEPCSPWSSMGAALRVPSQNSVGPVPRPSLSFPPLPSLGSSSLPCHVQT